MRHGLAAIAMMVIGCSKPAAQKYTSIVALDDGALVMWKRGIGRVDQRGQWLWRTDLRGVPQDWARHRSVLVDGDTVAVRTQNARESLLEGLELATGGVRWTAVLREHNDMSAGAGLSAQFAGFIDARAVHVYLTAGAGAGNELVDIDRATGATIRRQRMAIDRPTDAVRLAGDAVVHDAGGTIAATTRFDSPTITLRGRGCAARGDYWRLVNDANEWQIASLISGARIGLPSQAWRSMDACADYRSELVVMLRRDETHEILRLRDQPPFARLDLGGLVKKSRDWDGPEPLSRFVPVITQADDGAWLSVIDLERGEISWRARATGEDLIFRSGVDWILSRDRSGVELVTIAGTTGRVRAAAHIALPADTDVDEKNVGAGSVWLLSPDRKTFGRLDTETLRGCEWVTDARDAAGELAWE